MSGSLAESQPIEAWPDAIERELRAGATTLRRVVVLRETASTQGAAHDAGAEVGDVYVAWRQTHGRGRLGRTWADTGSEGVAATMVVPPAAPERMAMLAALASARAVLHCAPGAAGMGLGIKWPNDLMLRERKLGGALVEQSRARALVGIGINVAQAAFAPDLAARAISLTQVGLQVDRLAVVLALVRQLDQLLGWTDEALAEAYMALDALSGRSMAFDTPAGRVQGRVLSVHPLRGLVVDTAAGEVFLPAATTSVVVDPA
jgi:BirA family transcriptional regulator, biotin operon repressor / biotin---[acetyl-CoA-carboxylase] ligase